MLTYSLDYDTGEPLYEHLYECIKSDILIGILAPGAMLPSKRAFAKHLGVSTITVENSYAQLITEGFIYSIPRRGYYVADLSDIAVYNQKTLSRNEAEEEENTETSFDLHERMQDQKPAFDFASNQTTADSFPFPTWAKLTREVLNDRRKELMRNPISGGVRELREAIAHYLNDFRGLKVLPAQIVIGSGTEYLYGLLIQLLGFEKIYGIENPGYQKIHKIYDSYKVGHREIPLDQNGMNPSALEQSGADVVHLTPSHHFPTGITMPVSRRYEMLNWANATEGRYIIEDDYDSEFRMNRRPIPSLFSIDRTEKIIYMNTFTKSLASTVRVSYMVLPWHLIRRFYDTMSFYSCTVPTFEQYTLARFIREGYFEKHINRMRNSYRKKRDLVLKAIKNSELHHISSISEQDAGLHFLLKIEMDGEDEDFITFASKNGIRIMSLHSFYIGPAEDDSETKHRFIINYSSLEDGEIANAIDKLYEVCMSYRGI